MELHSKALHHLVRRSASESHVRAEAHCARANDEWSSLYRQQFPKVLRFIQKLAGTPCRTAAEDLTQEVFVIAFSRWQSFEGRSKVRTWLLGIAVNVVRSHRLRERRSSERLHLLRAEGEPAPAQHLEPPDLVQQRNEHAHRLRCRIAALPPTLRRAFDLHYLRGLSLAETATQLGISDGNLRVRLARARAILHAQLVARASGAF